MKQIPSDRWSLITKNIEAYCIVNGCEEPAIAIAGYKTHMHNHIYLCFFHVHSLIDNRIYHDKNVGIFEVDKSTDIDEKNDKKDKDTDIQNTQFTGDIPIIKTKGHTISIIVGNYTLTFNSVDFIRKMLILDQPTEPWETEVLANGFKNIGIDCLIQKKKQKQKGNRQSSNA